MRLEDGERDALRRQFIEYRRTGDPDLRDHLVEVHLRLAENLAWRFNNRGIPLDDLNQVAYFGLINAVDRFEPERGLEFTTFATPTILGELKRHFRDKGWSVRVPRRIQELHVELNSTIGQLTQRIGRSPTVPELAAATSSSEEEVLEAIEAAHAYRSASIDAPRQPGEGTLLSDQLGSEDVRLFDAENRLLVGGLLDRLPPREKLMLQLRFYQGMTQDQIAARLGISQMHVSRLLVKSLARLRRELDVADQP